ncbi:MAG: exodeoxyribonuclease VII small subunit [Oscillospiraceae bacterium]|jgi:exodeoxyribonuclease VII small subunit|nr:exodeoxyribonuclease VII small subunit [Oscillospiraceae bacterium]
MDSNEKQTFEQAVTRIDEIVNSLERGDAQLDKSLALFEEGVKLIEACGRLLDDAEQTVVRLQKTVSGEPKEYLFDDDGN